MIKNDKAYRIDNGIRKKVYAKNEYAKHRNDENCEYICCGQNSSGNNCGAKMGLRKGKTIKGKTGEPEFYTLKGEKHIQGCPYDKRENVKKVTFLNKNLNIKILNKMLEVLSVYKVIKEKPVTEKATVNKSVEESYEDDSDFEYERNFKNICNIKILYEVLSEKRLDDIIDNNITCKDILLDERSTDKYASNELRIKNGNIALVVARRTSEEMLYKNPKRENGEYVYYLEGVGKKPVYFRLTVSKDNWDLFEKIKETIFDKAVEILILGKWVTDENYNGCPVYSCRITGQKQVKKLN